jgi:hypothetical protein
MHGLVQLLASQSPQVRGEERERERERGKEKEGKREQREREKKSKNERERKKSLSSLVYYLSSLFSLLSHRLFLRWLLRASS